MGCLIIVRPNRSSLEKVGHFLKETSEIFAKFARHPRSVKNRNFFKSAAFHYELSTQGSFMLRSYVIVALRHMQRRKMFTLINTGGLAVGMACFWIIAQYVTFERSYDRFHANADRIYRVQLDQYKNDELIFKSSENYPAVGPALQREMPDVQAYARLYNLGSKNNVVITRESAPGGPISFKHRRFLYADSSFLPMFSYPLILGDATTALAAPFSMVLSESYARAYFGDANPIGQSLRMQDDDFNNEVCTITGVVADPPANTHLRFDVLISYGTLYSRFKAARTRYDESWQRKDMYTYVLLRPGADAASLQEKLAGFVQRHNPDMAKQFRRDELILQPVTDIHLYSRLTDEPEANGNGNSVYFLTIIGFAIILMAWINYINLATARSMDRAKEVGLRKVSGAHQPFLLAQFLTESFLANLFALIVSGLLVLGSWPYFTELTGLPIPFGLHREPWFYLAIVVMLLAGTLLAGFYPARVLASFQPVQVLKGSYRSSSSGLWMRRALVAAQFTASAALIIGTITVYDQLTYMRQQDLGLDLGQTIVVERPGVISRREDRAAGVQQFKDELMKMSSIRRVAGSLVLPGKKLRFKAETRREGGTVSDAVPLAIAGMDYDFMETFGLKLLAGRNFSRAYPNDPDTSVILTASAARLLGFPEPREAIGRVVAIDQFRWNPIVVGVVADYHHESLDIETQPTLFICTVEGVEYFFVKAHADNLPATLAFVKAAWERTFPGNPFEYFFLDEFFDRQYRSDQVFGKVFGLFAALAVGVGCLGLFGLTSFTISQRIKDIAIRKICGAPFGRLLAHLSKGMVAIVLLSSLVASPLMYYFMSLWLQQFAYRIRIGWEVFVWSGLALLTISLMTVSYHTIRAARTNPVRFLRYE